MKKFKHPIAISMTLLVVGIGVYGHYLRERKAREQKEMPLRVEISEAQESKRSSKEALIKEISKIQLMYPEDGATHFFSGESIPIKLQWTGGSEGSYTLRIHDGTFKDSPYIEKQTQDKYMLIDLKQVGQYHWMVLDKKESSLISEKRILNIIPKAPKIVSFEGIDVNILKRPGELEIKWEDSLLKNSFFEVQVLKDDEILGKQQKLLKVRENFVLLDFNKLDDLGQYHFQVKTLARGVASHWSAPKSLLVQAPAPPETPNFTVGNSDLASK